MITAMHLRAAPGFLALFAVAVAAPTVAAPEVAPTTGLELPWMGRRCHTPARSYRKPWTT